MTPAITALEIIAVGLVVDKRQSTEVVCCRTEDEEALGSLGEIVGIEIPAGGDGTAVVYSGSEVVDIVGRRWIDHINMNSGPTAWVQADVVRDTEGEVVLPCRIGSQ